MSSKRRVWVMVLAIFAAFLATFAWAGWTVHKHFAPIGPFAYEIGEIAGPLPEALALEFGRDALTKALPTCADWELVPAEDYQLTGDLNDRYFVRRSHNLNEGRLHYRNPEMRSSVFVHVERADHRVTCWVNRGK
jgi:hypothetical protein